MIPLFRLLLTAVVGFCVLAGAQFLRDSANADPTPELISGGELGAGVDDWTKKGTASEYGAKIALGNNANAVLSLDLIADGGTGNRRDDGATTGTVSGRGTTIAIEVFATGVRTSLAGIVLRFDFDDDLVRFVKAENSAFALSVPEGSVGVNLASTSPVTLASSGFLARAEFETLADVTGREFSIGVERVTIAESVTSSDVLRTTRVIRFNAKPATPAVLSLDLIADGGTGNRRDDGVTAGTVSGRGTTIAIEVFATGVRTSLSGMIFRFAFDASLVRFVKAENSAFALSIPEGSVGVNLASTSPVTLASSGFLARAEFETVANVTGREFSIGIERVTIAESATSSRDLTTDSAIAFNATRAATPDFDGDGTVGFSDFVAFAGRFGSSQGDAGYEARFDLDGDGSIGFSDFVTFAGAFGTAVGPPNGGGGGGGTRNPDLIVVSPSVDDNTLTPGQSFTLRATVRNQGNGSAGSTTLRYYRSSDATISTNDVEVGSDRVGGLSAGGTSAESIRLNAPSNAGTYTYGACVDGVSGESNTGNNCSRGVTVTVARVPTGPAPADQNAFDRLAVGKRILGVTTFVDVASAGRFSEGLRRHEGRYTYANTGANTGNLTQIYDNSELFGGRCTIEMTFTSASAGTMRYTCADGTAGDVEAWRATDLSAPVFVRASPDTLRFGILDTWQAGQTRAYDVQLRKKTPRGDWNDLCTTYSNRSDNAATAYAITWLSSANFEPNTTYEFRYRYRNSSSCDTGTPGPWSPIAEGTTSGSGTGGGGGSSSPDLIVDSPSVDDNTLTTGQSFRLSATVRNQGNASAGSTTLRYYRSSNSTISTNDTEVGTDRVGGLSAGGTSAESISLNAPSDAGTYYYGACVESVSGESNTDNNCSSGVSVTVSSGSGNNLGACRVGLVVRPNQSCTVSGATFRNLGGGCYNYSAFGSGRFCSPNFNLNGLRGTRSGSDFRITAVP